MARALHTQGLTHNIFWNFELLVIPSAENIEGDLQWTPSCSLLPYWPLLPLPGISAVCLPPNQFMAREALATVLHHEWQKMPTDDGDG